MKSLRWLYLLTLCLLFQSYLSAQEKLNIKFGKITASDVDLTHAKFDSSANALVISDIGNTNFEGDEEGGFYVIFKRFLREKIRNKNGLAIGLFKIPIHLNPSDRNFETAEVRGITYNLESGILVQTVLDPSSIYLDHYNKYIDLKVFRMPAAKEGSVLDVEYTIKSKYIESLEPWYFQEKNPCLWNEYTVTIPPVLHYVMQIKGDNQFDINTVRQVTVGYTLKIKNGTEMTWGSVKGNSVERHWVKKNVPAARSEPFLNTIKNYLPGVIFQLDYLKWNENDDKKNFLPTWPITCEKFLQEENFWASMDLENYWMLNELNSVTSGNLTDLEKARNIYSFIRDQFTCTNYNTLWTHSSLKDVFKKRGGNVAEINLLLAAMLRKAGITADPAILSTKDNGIACQEYPLINDYNYVICVARIKDESITLDASRPQLGFGNLVSDCYNGRAEVMNKDKPSFINLYADSLKESAITTVFIVNDPGGFPSGSLQTVYNAVESYSLRRTMKKESGQNYFKKIQTAYGDGIKMENTGIDSLDNPDMPLAIHYDFNLPSLANLDVFYFNPILDNLKEKNPFIATNRQYPVELPYRIDETYVLSMDIPSGFEIDELPKSAKVNLNGNDGFFEYIIDAEATMIQMRVRVKLNKTFFPTEEYSNLRDFYAHILKKESEQIVFKKKSKS